MNKLEIPDTDSIKELARFWDTHDLTDFEDRLEQVTEPIFGRKVGTIVVRLQPQEVEAVKRIAKFKGVGRAALIRGWVLERIYAS